MKIRIMNAFKDGKAFWLGLDEEGMRRKVFRLMDPERGAKHMVCGLTIFEPGEASSLHNHPGSEELNIAIRGRGVVRSEGEEREFQEMDFMFIPEGVEHQHINTGDEPLWLFFIYTPPGQLPKT